MSSSSALSRTLIAGFTIPVDVGRMVATTTTVKLAMISIMLATGCIYLAIHTGTGCVEGGPNNIDLFFGPVNSSGAKSKSGSLTMLQVRNSTGHWNNRTDAIYSDDNNYFIRVDPRNPVSCLHSYDAGRDVVRGFAIFMAAMFGLGSLAMFYMALKNKATMYASFALITTFLYGFVTMAFSLGVYYIVDALHHQDPLKIDHKSGHTMLMLVGATSAILSALYGLLFAGSEIVAIMTIMNMRGTDFFKYVSNYTARIQTAVGSTITVKQKMPPGSQDPTEPAGIHCLAVNAHVRDESLALFSVFLMITLCAFLGHGMVGHNIDGHPIKSNVYVQGRGEIIWVNGTLNTIYGTSGSPGAALSAFTAGNEIRVEYTGPTTAMWELKHYFTEYGTMVGVFMVVIVCCAIGNMVLDAYIYSNEKLTFTDPPPIDGIETPSENKWFRSMSSIGATLLAIVPMSFLTDTITMFQYDLSGQNGAHAPERTHVVFSVVAATSLVAVAIFYSLASIQVSSPFRVLVKRPEKTDQYKQ
ncbi:MAG: hypothetical protein EBZ60_05785 [Betaproteobacteria bacterium]|nr:hypothetical protein [Betaproteobacteria bacterium]